jgi:hypothetical protein
LALHQFNPRLYSPILKELNKVSKKIIIVDYAVPLPKTVTGYLAHFIEFMAGKEHNQNFKKFYKQGGLEPILKTNGFQISTKKKFAKGIFNLVVCSSPY